MEKYNGTITLENFSEIVIDEFKEAFSLYSDNKEQKIYLDVFAVMLADVSLDPLVFTHTRELPRDRLIQMFEQADLNGDRKINFTEFTSAILGSLDSAILGSLDAPIG